MLKKHEYNFKANKIYYTPVSSTVYLDVYESQKFHSKKCEVLW